MNPAQIKKLLSQIDDITLLLEEIVENTKPKATLKKKVAPKKETPHVQ